MEPLYLDFNATTPIDPLVAAVMMPFIRDGFGNPSSIYEAGVNVVRMNSAHLNEEGTELTVSDIFTGAVLHSSKLPKGFYTSQAYEYRFAFKDGHTISYQFGNKHRIVRFNP